jgi:hypothetical protein
MEANIDSDHFLIIAKLQCKISRYYRHNKLTESKRHDITKPLNPETEAKYIAVLTFN